MKAKEAFRKTGLLDSPNFMTPSVIGYYEGGNGLYAEISEGGGITSSAIIGVTIVEEENGITQHRTDLGKVFSGTREMALSIAWDYWESLQEGE